MRRLRYLGPGDDPDHVVVETADGDEQFVLYIDSPLREAARSDLPKLHPSAPEPVATITPREIQMRVRSGVSPQALADEHDMTLERVLRFAGAVLEERSRIADEARRARARRGTADAQAVVFGEVVDGRFTAHGIDPLTVSWDAHRDEDGQWIVTAGWIGGKTERIAQWVFHLATRTVTPMDDTATDLLSDRPIRPLRPAGDPPRPSLVAAPALLPGVVAFPPMADAHTARLPSAEEIEDVYDQDALDEDPRHVAAQQDPASSATYDAPRLPLRLAEAPAATEQLDAADAVEGVQPTEATGATGADPAQSPDDGPEPETTTPPEPPTKQPAPKLTNLGIAKRADESEEEHAARARIPSWDDILLGVRRKGD